MKRVLLLAGLFGPLGATAQKAASASPLAPTPLEQGVVANDKRVGKWQFYNRRHELELTFDYDSSRIAYSRPDTARYLVWQTEAWVLKHPLRVPHILGSTDQRLDDLLRQLRYPVSALQQQLQGTVVIGYTVDANGHTRDYTVENSLSPDCDQEVWKALQKLPDNWIPAFYAGRPIATRFYVSVQFRIEMQGLPERRPRKGSTALAAQLAGDAPAPAKPGLPPYAHEVIVTALGIER
jgi:TonB family protein